MCLLLRLLRRLRLRLGLRLLRYLLRLLGLRLLYLRRCLLLRLQRLPKIRKHLHKCILQALILQLRQPVHQTIQLRTNLNLTFRQGAQKRGILSSNRNLVLMQKQSLTHISRHLKCLIHLRYIFLSQRNPRVQHLRKHLQILRRGLISVQLQSIRQQRNLRLGHGRQRRRRRRGEQLFRNSLFPVYRRLLFSRLHLFGISDNIHSLHLQNQAHRTMVRTHYFIINPRLGNSLTQRF